MWIGLAVLLGLMVGILVGMNIGWQYALLAGWDGFSIGLLAILWHDFHGKSATKTGSITRSDDMGSTAFDTVITRAALASLGTVLTLLTTTINGVGHIVFGLASIVLSWAMIHAACTLWYAVMYYDDDDGISLGGAQQPTFSDFAYVAYTMDMPYQVSDISLTSACFRRVVPRHALLSFVFGVAIIATSINVVAGLGQ